MAWLATFAVPLLLYLLVWECISQDVLNRVGYIFWTVGGTEAQTTIFRIELFDRVFTFLPGILLGMAALGWRAIVLRRRAGRE